MTSLLPSVLRDPIDWTVVLNLCELMDCFEKMVVFNLILSHKPPVPYLKAILEIFSDEILNYECCPDPTNPLEEIYASPITCCCLFGLCDDSFRLILQATSDKFHYCVSEEDYMYQSEPLISSIDLIPLHRLEVLCEAFPDGTATHHIDECLAQPTALQDLNRFTFILRHGLKMHNLLEDGDSECLLPHMFLTYFLKGDLPPTGDGSFFMSQDEERRIDLLQIAPAILERIHAVVPDQFEARDGFGRTCLEVLIQNADYIFGTLKRQERHLQTLVKQLLKISPSLARMPGTDGRCPLFMTIEKGYLFVEELSSGAPELLEQVCPINNLYPFQLAGYSRERKLCKNRIWLAQFAAPALDMIYKLLRKAPHVLAQFIPDEGNPVDTVKCRKLARIDLEIERLNRRYRADLDALLWRRSEINELGSEEENEDSTASGL